MRQAPAFSRASASSSVVRSVRTSLSSIRSLRCGCVFSSAALYVQDRLCGLQANSARNLAGSAAHDPAFREARTHGGFGFAREFHVERYFRESVLHFIAPVSEELIFSYVAEKSPGMSKSC